MGFCISSYLADSIYKVDCIAEVFVLALKCQNSTSFPPLKEGCLRIMGTFSPPITNLCYGQRKTEFQRTWL